jgi:ABC-type sugar transport system ATPase subunit
LRRELEISMVYVTHDREDATVLADEVVEMRAGSIVSGMRTAQPRPGG